MKNFNKKRRRRELMKKRCESPEELQANIEEIARIDQLDRLIVASLNLPPETSFEEAVTELKKRVEAVKAQGFDGREALLIVLGAI